MRRGRHRKHSRHHVRHKHHRRAVFKGIDNSKEVDKIVERSKLLQDILGFTTEGVTNLFQDGLVYLQANQFDEAIKIFTILTRMNPYVADFWIALGLVYQALEKNRDALTSFLVAQTMDPSTIDSYLNAIECCIQLKDYQQAEAIIKLAMHFAKKHPHDEATLVLLKEIDGMIDRIYAEKEKV